MERLYLKNKQPSHNLQHKPESVLVHSYYIKVYNRIWVGFYKKCLRTCFNIENIKIWMKMLASNDMKYQEIHVFLLMSCAYFSTLNLSLLLPLKISMGNVISDICQRIYVGWWLGQSGRERDGTTYCQYICHKLFLLPYYMPSAKIISLDGWIEYVRVHIKL